MNGSNHGAMSRAASSTALDVQQLSGESNQRRHPSSTTPVGAMSRGASFSTALDVLDADSLNDFDTKSPEKGTDVSAPAEWDGTKPDAVLARLKAIKENAYSPLGLKAFYKSYTTLSKLNAEQQDKALAWFRKLPDGLLLLSAARTTSTSQRVGGTGAIVNFIIHGTCCRPTPSKLGTVCVTSKNLKFD
jgi:hypothetical protein